MLSADQLEALTAPLRRAQKHGWIGRGEIPALSASAARFAEVVPSPPDRAVDLGSGGGIPGLVLAMLWPSSTWLLTDRDPRRCAHLRLAVQELELASRVRIAEGDAADWSRSEDHRGHYDLLVSRSFGPPAVTVESGVAFLEVGGTLVVSDPPDLTIAEIEARWPDQGLNPLGVTRQDYDQAGPAMCVLEKVAESTGIPRPDVDPRSSPLF